MKTNVLDMDGHVANHVDHGATWRLIEIYPNITLILGTGLLPSYRPNAEE